MKLDTYYRLFKPGIEYKFRSDYIRFEFDENMIISQDNELITTIKFLKPYIIEIELNDNGIKTFDDYILYFNAKELKI